MLTKEEVVIRLANIHAEMYEALSDGILQIEKMKDLKQQIEELQKKCPHNFSDNGTCSYCGKKENDK